MGKVSDPYSRTRVWRGGGGKPGLRGSEDGGRASRGQFAKGADQCWGVWAEGTLGSG